MQHGTVAQRDSQETEMVGVPAQLLVKPADLDQALRLAIAVLADIQR